MFSKLKLRRQALILAGLLLVFQIIFVGTICGIVYQMHEQVVKDSRLRQISLAAFKLLRYSSEIVPKLNLEPTTGVVPADEKAKRKAAADTLTGRVNALAENCRPFPEMDEPVAQLRSTSTELINLFIWMGYHQQFGKGHWESLNNQFDDKLGEICSAVFEVLPSIQELADRKGQKNLQEVKELRRTMTWVLWAGIPFSVVLATILGILYAGGVRRPLERAKENCRLMVERRELLPPLSGGNEISELDRSIHEIAIDVKRALERDELLIDNALDVICSISGDGIILTANKSIERLLGVRPQEVRNKKVFELVPAENRSDFRTFLEESRADGQIKTLDVPVVRIDGSLVDTSWTCFWSEEHKTTFSVVHDVSKLKEADRQQREFLDLVTLDLREPLVSVAASLSAIGQNKQGEKQGGNLSGNKSGSKSGNESEIESESVMREIESARSNLRQLLAFADDLVDFQRLQIGEMKMHFEEANLGRVVSQAIDLLQPLVTEKNVAILFEPKGETTIRCDEVKITKVLTNFLSNAIKWSPSDAAIDIELKKVGDYLEVAVSDDGPGIPEDHVRSVFEAFEQIPGSSKKQGGTGLGLAICRQIVEAHGGAIGVRKRNEVRFAPRGPSKDGSVFWFTLPISVTAT